MPIHESADNFNCAIWITSYTTPCPANAASPCNKIGRILFTSPPYFSVERYSYDDTQSWVRYKDIDDWNELFLQKSLDNVWKTIKPGGYLLVNISDVNASSKGRKAKGWLPICDPMNDFLDTLEDSEYQGCIGYEMAKRPNSGGAGTAKTYEGSVWTEKSLENKADKNFFLF